MSPELYAWLGSGIAVGVAIASWPAAVGVAPRRWPSLVGLGGVIAALLAVGVESGTVLRHVIQLAPAIVALVLVVSHSAYGRAATLPILPFWIALMLTIWRYLFGMTRIIGGHFTSVEVVLTVGIAAACVAGLIGGPRPTANLSAWRRAATAVAFGALQLAALWASMQPFASGR
jgi:hypothetical protein